MLALLPLLLTAGLGAAEDLGFQVVVNDANSVASLSAEELSRLFLRKTQKWDDGTAVRPVDQLPDSAVRASFSEAVHGRKVAAIKSFWQKLIFSGRGTPPPEVEADSEVLLFVANNPSGVGYVSPGAVLPAGVRAVEVTR